ncbi:hypothetical protein BpHYR1_012076 [Brachionus plicatilis]|uniref:Uncharacterized protein n=1 Tax=Brachionus plicatilis TaxID=10195 RepID=A0A3M7SRY1_BRAPC|nr:hypothetical protein BpHYR1_012076 [Brachionus plicatilis]
MVFLLISVLVSRFFAELAQGQRYHFVETTLTANSRCGQTIDLKNHNSEYIYFLDILVYDKRAEYSFFCNQIFSQIYLNNLEFYLEESYFHYKILRKKKSFILLAVTINILTDQYSRILTIGNSSLEFTGQLNQGKKVQLMWIKIERIYHVIIKKYHDDFIKKLNY